MPANLCNMVNQPVNDGCFAYAPQSLEGFEILLASINSERTFIGGIISRIKFYCVHIKVASFDDAIKMCVCKV